MRHDGIQQNANNIQQALGTTASRDAVNNIATGAARFYSSDVVYKDYVVPQVLAALKNAGVTPPTQPVSGQFLPNLGWLTPNFVASQLHVALPQPANAKCVPGQLVGQALNSVSVGGTTLQTGSTNTVSANPPPAFTLNVTNGGQTTIQNVQLTVKVEGTNVSGKGTITQTSPGETTTGTVTLSSSPPTGQTYTVAATVVPVHCETNTSNNTLTFPVTFQ
jgi:archaellum component FlaF (FlaF/FlaG flagellin family)